MNLSLLVLTDFFQAANRALDYATNLAGTLPARLVLLHVREQLPATTEPPAAALTNLSPEAMTLALNCLTQDLPVPVVAEVGLGALPAAAADAVHRHHPALLVLGRRDEPTPTGRPLTATALELLRAAPAPVLVVPTTVGRAAPPRRILLAVDGQPFSFGEHAGTARQLLRALHAELTLLHCAPAAGTPASVAAVADSVLRTGLTIDLPPVHTRWVVGPDPAAAILRAAGEFDAVLLVARRRSFWGQLFHRSVTARVLEGCPVPVLLLPAAA